MDIATSFGTAAQAYERARPVYPAEAVRWLLPRPGAIVLDVGAGTGKLTGRLVREGHDVRAVDPDATMLKTLSRRLPSVATTVGSAEALPVDDMSIDAVTFGQSWHWVDPVSASRETARVLRPGGLIGLFWNIRDESVDWVRELSTIMHSSAAERLLSEGPPEVAPPFVDLEHRTWEWTAALSAEALVDLAASRSHVIALDADARDAVLARVRALGERVADAEGMVQLPYRTHVFRALRP